MKFQASNDNAVDNRVDRSQDNGGCPMSYPFEQALSQSFSQVVSNEERSLFLDHSPPTSVVGSGQGASGSLVSESEFVSVRACSNGREVVSKCGVRELRVRDFELISFLVEQGYLDLNRVAKYFFKGRKSNACRRLGQLSKSKLVRKEVACDLLGEVTVYCPTENARRVYEGCHGNMPTVLKYIYPRLVDHTLFVADVRRRFEEIWKFEWIPEVVLKAENKHITPDGVLYFRDTNRSISIEVEITIKSVARYRELFRAYVKRDYDLIIYVTRHAGVFEMLKTIVNEDPSAPPVGIFKWDELKNSKPVMWSPVGDIDILNRVQPFKTKKEAKM